MDWSTLSFLAEPWFVISWYAVGVLGAAWVIADIHRHNTVLKQAIAWGWPIIVLFFSVIGLALYWLTARAQGIEDLATREAKQRAHDRYQQSMLRRVNGAVIHCVAGDGLGIMTGMVIARLAGMSFWQEFWFEYLVGFLFGWLIFQLESMLMMTRSVGRALAMAFRAEFFSMLTVMAGMGAVMTYVTPMVVGAQPKPLTYAFWGFGMLGLLAGYICTFPMNWMMVRLGWKHGMGSAEGARPVEARRPRLALLTGMVALGLAALALPAWLTELRNDGAQLDTAELVRLPQTSGSGVVFQRGLATTLESAERELATGDRARGTRALDAARRLTRIAEQGAPTSAGAAARQQVRQARHLLQTGRPAASVRRLDTAMREVIATAPPRPNPPADLERYRGATVVNAEGREIGEIAGVDGADLVLATGGWRDVWGWLDFGGRRAPVPPGAFLFGPAGPIGPTLVALAVP